MVRLVDDNVLVVTLCGLVVVFQVAVVVVVAWAVASSLYIALSHPTPFSPGPVGLGVERERDQGCVTSRR